MQHLFFQITITLNPIIIHKLWEKIFNQSWWEIKVRRPRHGNDSIFAHTLQRPPWGPGPGDRIQKADILPLLSVTSDQVVWPPSQCGGKWRLSLRWVRSLITGARHGAGAGARAASGPGPRPETRRRGPGAAWTLDKHTSSLLSIIFSLKPDYFSLFLWNESWVFNFGFFFNSRFNLSFPCVTDWRLWSLLVFDLDFCDVMEFLTILFSMKLKCVSVAGAECCVQPDQTKYRTKSSNSWSLPHKALFTRYQIKLILTHRSLLGK